MFKAITGGDMISGERKFQPPFTFRPFARLLYSANQPPPTSDSSDAFFRRWEILPFERSFQRTAQPRLLDALTTPSERSGLLNHALEALPRLATGGFTGTIASTRAADRFQADADSVAGFISERCYLEEGVRIDKPSLALAYKDWCAENDCRRLSTQRFNERLRELVPEKSRGEVTVHGSHLWDGIALTQERGL